jgi:hypothetical protein
MKPQTVDTPRANSWHTQVNQPNFIPSRPKRDVVHVRTINAAEARELRAVLHGSN